MKYLFITTSSYTVLSFRKNLITYLLKNGHSVCVICGDENCRFQIENIGALFFLCKMNNRSLNPFNELKYISGLKKLIKEIKPDCLFSFQLKPNLYGSVIAHHYGIVRIFSMIEGVGDAFSKTGFTGLISKLYIINRYKKSFKYCKNVFFLNNSDKNFFITKKMISKEKPVLINGIGVDLNYFASKNVKNYKNFIMISRMLVSKGVFDYCECARIVKQKYPDTVFNYLGLEGDIDLKDIDGYVKSGFINYLGFCMDVRPFLQECSALILPSYYGEGLPMSIMEAESVGRCIITTDSVGCRDTIIDGYNGLLVSKKDPCSIAKACIYLIEHPDEIIRFGANARKFAEKNWDSTKINESIYQIISK